MPKALPKPEYINPRGIPQAPFLGSIDEYASDLEEATALLRQLQEQLQKYQFMELATTNRAKNLQSKLPDLQKSLESSKFLKQQTEPFESQYALNDTLYAKAEIHPVKSVWLWLGANVMLEYPIDEALDTLQSKLDATNKGLEACHEDLEFLRENITTMEVNTARAINWQVAYRKKHPAAAAAVPKA